MLTSSYIFNLKSLRDSRIAKSSKFRNERLKRAPVKV